MLCVVNNVFGKLFGTFDPLCADCLVEIFSPFAHKLGSTFPNVLGSLLEPALEAGRAKVGISDYTSSKVTAFLVDSAYAPLHSILQPPEHSPLRRLIYRVRQSGAFWADANSRARVPTTSLNSDQKVHLLSCLDAQMEKPSDPFAEPCYSRHTGSMSCWYKLPASRGTPSWPYRPASSASHPDILPLAGPRSCDCQYGGWWSREAGGQLVVAASVSSSTSLLEPGSESQEERRGL